MSVPVWKKILKENFTSLKELAAFLELDEAQEKELIQNKHFPLLLPRRLAAKIQKQTLADPILRQFVPLRAELERNEGFAKDPVGDDKAACTAKYLKKYEGRALLLLTQACAMHCRFCFRQNYPYAPLQSGFEEELQLIREDATLKEIILSGGDPLSLNNSQLNALFVQLSSIEHIKRIRFHTRFPIGIPERIDTEFLEILARYPKQIWFIIHCNHPKELDEDVLLSLKNIQKLGIPVLNQHVLLKGVNDSLETLQALYEKLSDNGIFPYYLHQLDRVEGAAHFEVPPIEGKQLIEELIKRLSGYAIPKYVQEIAGQPSKTLL